jgi:hypothetical protein
MSTEVAIRSSTAKRKPNVERGEWWDTFLQEYATTGHVSNSAAVAGVSRDAIYKARENNEEFAAAFQRARKIAGHELEGVAVQRAKNHSDTLLIFLLKGLMPDVYGDKVLHGHTGQVNIKLVYDE